MLRWHVVSAVFERNVKQYFSGPLGYLFIVVFVTVCAVMAFSAQFFADNLANLDQLSRWFPMLLLFFIPAVTMSVWADEKRQGTDSILFTLPASDLDILLGKYLAVAAVYTIALLFSMTQLIVLAILGSPDWGVVF
jgi:ABC-2 type transport system permease protein